MSLGNEWAEELDDIYLTYLYRLCNTAIEGNRQVEAYELIPSKGEQDTAWAVKHEYEERAAKNPEFFGNLIWGKS
jgi:hypothetical protein